MLNDLDISPNNTRFSPAYSTGPNAQAAKRPENIGRQRMPFIRKLIGQPAKGEITFAYTLDLDEDLYLNDHLFIQTSQVKPPEACMPVMPMAFSMEMMAEAAACLAPGCGLIGFEQVRASQWIDLNDGRQAQLIVSAAHVGDDRNGSRRFQTTIRKQGVAAPMISATVLLGRRYVLSITSRFEKDDVLRPFPFTTEYLYRERFLFHGPLLHCIARIQGTGKKTIVAQITAAPDKQLFRSIKQPQLLTAPDLIDGLAQLLCAWFVDKSWRALPIGIEKMEIYRPVPEPGVSLPVFLQIMKSGKKNISIDLEVQDGARKVWMRIKNWRYWIIRLEPQMSDFLRIPDKYTISDRLNLPSLPAGVVARLIHEQNLRDVNLDWLARTCLHLNELPDYKKLAGQPAQQRDWLLSRTVAKDAVRLWWSQNFTTALLHPAALQLGESKPGELAVRGMPAMPAIPRIRVAKANSGWAGIAYDEKDHMTVRDSALFHDRPLVIETEVATCR